MGRMIDVPADIQEFGERYKIPEFANATYRNGYEQCTRDHVEIHKARVR